MSDWHFGDYLRTRLEELGGKRAGKTQSWLADAAGISQSYANYLLSGRASGKKDPPRPTIEIFQGLSKALNVELHDLVDIYLGVKPSEAKKKSKPLSHDESFSQALMVLFRSLPIDEQIAMMEGQRERLVNEARRLEKEDK